MMSGEYKMNRLDQYLTDTHTVDGLIQFDDSVNVMTETVENLQEDAEMDYEDLVTYLLESDLMVILARSIIRNKTIDFNRCTDPEVKSTVRELEKLHRQNLQELVEHKLNCR